MDRDTRREIRKRGAASRQLATDSIVIRTPKRSVASDSGALITEQISRRHSPLYQRQYQGEHVYPDEDLTTEVPAQQLFVDPALVSLTHHNRRRPSSHHQHRDVPRTPEERIGYAYEPASMESNRSVVSSKRTPQKTKASQTSSLHPLPAKAQSQKKRSSNTTKKSKKSKKSRAKEPEDDFETDGAYTSVAEDYYSSLDEFALDESDEDALGGAPTMEISRLPTTSSRLTSIDVVLHYLRLQTPRSSTFDNFSELNETMFAEILDLNLVNNHYVYQLRDLKADKQELRQKILERRKQVSEEMAKLEKLRSDHNEVRKLLAAKWRISHRLKEAKMRVQVQDDKDDKSARLMAQLDKLSNVLDPNWSLVDKLKALNDKLYEIDKKVTA